MRNLNFSYPLAPKKAVQACSQSTGFADELSHLLNTLKLTVSLAPEKWMGLEDDFFWLPFGASKGLFLGVPLLLVLGRTLAIWLYMILSS